MSRARAQRLIHNCLVGLLLSAYCTAFASEQPETAAADADVQRGRLLYETHCIACHTTQAHWRDKHIVSSWADLLYQVSRWQKNAGQDWSSEEINDVAAYLNETFYKMP
jgi:mono/diheme cytochrome c family protein